MLSDIQKIKAADVLEHTNGWVVGLLFAEETFRPYYSK